VTTETQGPVRGQFCNNGSKLCVIYEASPFMTVMDPVSLQVSNRINIQVPASARLMDTKRIAHFTIDFIIPPSSQPR
jgi:hypothetical protein